MTRQQETSNAQMIHHYTHVVCALNETRKGSPSDVDPHGATAALEQTIKGVCALLDVMVTAEHKAQSAPSVRAVS